MNNEDLPDRLIAVAGKLYRESEGFAECPEDSQQWYNRGYADGMVKALVELGYGRRIVDLHQRMNKTAAVMQAQEKLPWGKACRHGEDKGYRETREVFSAADSQAPHQSPRKPAKQ